MAGADSANDLKNKSGGTGITPQENDWLMVKNALNRADRPRGSIGRWARTQTPYLLFYSFIVELSKSFCVWLLSFSAPQCWLWRWWMASSQ